MGLRLKSRAANDSLKLAKEALENQVKKDHDAKQLRRKGLPPTGEIIEVKDTEVDTSSYIPLEVKGSNGKTYKIMIPHSYAKLVPKTWAWNEKRYKAAGLIADGLSMSKVADAIDVNRVVIYGWLQHPEFKEHVDGLILETGWANKQERIAGLNKLTNLLFEKVVNEIDQVKLTDKSIGAVLSSIQMIAKQLGVEKQEIIEQTRVEQQTNVTGTVGIATVNINDLLNSKPTEEREQLVAEFNACGDDIIRAITGEKE